MNDGSWDNGGQPEAPRGMPLWGKVLLGCGCGCGLILLVIAGSCVAFVRWAEKDPAGVEQRFESWAKSFVKDDWTRFRAAVEQLRTEEGSRALFTANPDLREEYESEATFLKAASQWRPLLAPVPVELPDHRGNNLDVNKTMSETRIGYTDEKGTRLRITFGKRGVKRIDVRPGLRRQQAEAPEER